MNIHTAQKFADEITRLRARTAGHSVADQRAATHRRETTEAIDKENLAQLERMHRELTAKQKTYREYEKASSAAEKEHVRRWKALMATGKFNSEENTIEREFLHRTDTHVNQHQRRLSYEIDQLTDHLEKTVTRVRRDTITNARIIAWCRHVEGNRPDPSKVCRQLVAAGYTEEEARQIVSLVEPGADLLEDDEPEQPAAATDEPRKVLRINAEEA